MRTDYILGPSPDEESPSLSNSRRPPPRPLRRKKKIIAASESDEENDGNHKENIAARPKPLPRRQKQESQNNESENMCVFVRFNLAADCTGQFPMNLAAETS